MSALLWIGLVAGVIVGGVWLLTLRGRAAYRLEARRLERIAGLSVGEASLRLRALLDDSTLFRTTVAPLDIPIGLQLLAPELRGLLQQYESIELLKGPGAELRRSLVGPALYGSGFVRIGTVAEASDVEGEVAVKPEAETVYVLDAGEAPDPVFGTYKSVYHWLLAAAEEQQR